MPSNNTRPSAGEVLCACGCGLTLGGGSYTTTENGGAFDGGGQYHQDGGGAWEGVDADSSTSGVDDPEERNGNGLRQPIGWRAVAVVAVIAMGVAMTVGNLLASIGSSYVTYRPGPVFDAAEFVTIDGGRAAGPTAGPDDDTLLVLTLMMTDTVVPELFEQIVEPAVELHPRPDSQLSVDWQQQNIDSMAEAKDSAAWAAAAALGVADPLAHSLGAAVIGVFAGAPADGALRVGDIIEAVTIAGNVTHIDTNTDLSELVGAQPPGTELIVDFKRRGKPQQAQITTAALPEGTATGGGEEPSSIIGVVVQTYGGDLKEVLGEEGMAEQHLNVDWDSSIEVGGPSAGLAFALEILDQGSDIIEDRGRTVAVTGSIDRLGNVGPVGGLLQKTQAAVDAGADMFIVPEANYPDVVAALEKIGVEGPEVVAVTHLDEAIAALNR